MCGRKTHKAEVGWTALAVPSMFKKVVHRAEASGATAVLTCMDAEANPDHRGEAV